MTADNHASIPEGKQPTTRRTGAYALLLLFSFGILSLGCSGSSEDNSEDSPEDREQTIVVSNDIDELKKFIELPGDVKRGEWQTGKMARYGGDWWLAAILEVESEDTAKFLRGAKTKQLFDTPPGLKLTSSFAALKSIPGAQPIESNRTTLIVDAYGVEPYAKSPLLHGDVIQLSETQVLVVLFTM